MSGTSYPAKYGKADRCGIIITDVHGAIPVEAQTLNAGGEPAEARSPMRGSSPSRAKVIGRAPRTASEVQRRGPEPPAASIR